MMVYWSGCEPKDQVWCTSIRFDNTKLLFQQSVSNLYSNYHRHYCGTIQSNKNKSTMRKEERERERGEMGRNVTIIQNFFWGFETISSEESVILILMFESSKSFPPSPTARHKLFRYCSSENSLKNCKKKMARRFFR